MAKDFKLFFSSKLFSFLDHIVQDHHQAGVQEAEVALRVLLVTHHTAAAVVEVHRVLVREARRVHEELSQVRAHGQNLSQFLVELEVHHFLIDAASPGKFLFLQ
jgi:hypothetical protein